jgi:hypothetical protein
MMNKLVAIVIVKENRHLSEHKWSDRPPVPSALVDVTHPGCYKRHEVARQIIREIILIREDKAPHVTLKIAN